MIVDRESTGAAPLVFSALAAVLVLFFGIQLIDGVLSHIMGGDGASYVLLAKSLATGHGFSDINLPGAPPHTQYPPLLPAVMAPVFYFAGYNFAVMGVVITLLGAAAVLFASRYFARIESPWLGALIALGVATNFFFLMYVREVTTEVPFVLIALLTLYFIETHDEDPRLSDGYRPYLLALPILVALAYMTRMIGVTLYAAVVVRLAVNVWESPAEDGLRRAEIKRLATFAAMAIIPFAAWTVRNTFFAGDVAAYQSVFFRADYYSTEAGALGLASLLARFVKNAGYYAQILPMTVFPVAPVKAALHPDIAYRAFSTVILLFMLAGFVHRLVWRRSVMEFFLLFYFAIVTVWPTYGSMDGIRYAVPMIPFLYYYLFRGVWLVAGLAGGFAGAGTVKGVPVAVAAVALLAVNLYAVKGFLWPPEAAKKVASGVEAVMGRKFEAAPGPDPRALGAKFFKDDMTVCYSRYIDASWYLSTLMAPGELVMTRKPGMAHLASGRLTVRFPYTADMEAMDEFVEKMGVDYILLDACYPEALEYLHPYILARQDRFGVVLDDKEGTMVLKLVDGGK